MKLILLMLLFSTALLLKADTNKYFTVTIYQLDGKTILDKMTNCHKVYMHTNNCWLIYYGTNEFHAWMVPIRIEEQKKKL